MLSYDEKIFLDLLHEHKSDDTKKARRNLSVISFVVTAVWILGIRLTDLKVLGVDLTTSHELNVRLLALVLIGYWGVMFSLAWRHDSEIQKERSIALTTMVRSLEERMASILETKKANVHYQPSDYGDVKSALDTYMRQQERTISANRLGRIIRGLELYVPIGLALFAATILLVGIIRAL
jgi:hypothetical protein